jgi:hypothetical protein
MENIAMIKTLIVAAVVGAVLAVGGVAAAMQALNPSAEEVATDMTAKTQGGAGDPLAPPDFYGSR